METNSPLIITINRQLGSGGAYVGQKLAERLNILYADREIIDQAAQKLSVMVTDLESQEEKVPSFWKSVLKSFVLGTSDAYIPPQLYIPTDKELFETETKIIQQIATEHSAVIIGRCGCHILRNHPNRVAIYLHSDVAFRRERIQQLQNVSEKEAEKLIAQSDRERAQYYQTFTGKVWADARQYDLSINSGKIGLDESVELILKFLKS